MAITVTGSGNGKGKGGKRLLRNLPVKRSINLALVEEKKISIPKALLGILIIIALAAVFSKFLVADRLLEMSRAEAAAAQKKADLDKLYAALSDFGNIEEEYAHVTYDDMTADELSLVDRPAVIDLIKTVLPKKRTYAWSLAGNVLTVEVSARNLKKLNQLVKRMEESPIVDTCTITTANKNDKTEEEGQVRGRMIVYLQQPAEPVEEEKEP